MERAGRGGARGPKGDRAPRGGVSNGGRVVKALAC